MLRQSTPEPPHNNSSTPESSPTDQPGDVSEQPSSSSPRRMSKDSEGYPSWLPKRPPPPPPASTFQSSSAGIHESGTIEPQFVGGRKPTPRSVRIVSLHDPSYAEKGRREATDQTRVGNPPRVWSRATGATVSPAAFSSGDPLGSRITQPKFRSQGLHIELLRKPSLKSRLYFYIFPLFVFAHIPLQTFFDFNTVFILFQVSKFPNPQAPGVPGSGRNWALGAAAYVACWFVWIIVVCVVYELVYSFVRRWRVKRPFIIPIYLSSPAFNLAAIRSYSNFCFLQHIRYSAFFGESGSLRDGLAETFWFYSQNLPTIALLIPRAGLALALLLAFSSPQVGVVALADAGASRRDATFFRMENGTLTSYARGVLIANAAWTAWRVIVLWASLIGLWVVSGQGCAGLCGPRYRWDEEDAEKNKSFYNDTASDLDAIPWSWRECSQMRVQEAFEFCLTVRPSLRWTRDKKEISDASDLLGSVSPVGEPLQGMEQVLAAVGFPSVPPPARRGVLSDDLFESPKSEHPPAALSELSDIIPKVAKRSSKEQQVAGPSAPLMTLPYPFTAQGAQASSADRVPFPPSPVPTDNQSSDNSPVEEEDDQDEDDDNEEEEREEVEQSEEPSTGRASGSMSSLGQPVSSRYPFQFRRPGRGNSISSGAPSHMTPTSNSRSMQSRISHSTGNRESSDSQSPGLHTASSSEMLSISQGSPIPMPPRHPQQSQGRGRARAGTVPAAISSSPTPIVFPMGGRQRASTRVGGDIPDSPRISESAPPSSELDHGESDNEHVEHAESDSHEAAERDDIVGLLSPSTAPSPKTSIAALRGRAAQHRFRGSGSGSGSDSRTNSHSSSSRSRTNSISISVRSRAQSLMQNIGAASHSSLELVQTAIRSRANSSMARLEEDSPHESDAGTHSRTGSSSDAVQSSNENYTFGHPLRPQWHTADDQRLEEESAESPSQSSPRIGDSYASLPESLPSQQHSEITVSPRLDIPEAGTVQERSSPIEIPRSGVHHLTGYSTTSSPPDISTAAQSFVTAPATIEGTTDSSGRTISSWGDISHMVDRSDGTWRPAPA